MSNIALIPCRGGSKGIIKKNLQLVHGVPLVIRTVSACLSGGIDEVFVSTDDEDIAAYATAAGARVISRPSEISQDTSSTDEVLSHAVETLLDLGFTRTDNLFLLQSTSPFTRKETIENAILTLSQNVDHGVFTASEWHGFIWEIKEDYVIPLHHDHLNRKRRQELSKCVLETGGLYGASLDSFDKSRIRFVEPLHPLLVSRIESIEIDTWDDLNFCNQISFDSLQLPREKTRVIFSDFDGVLTDNRVYQLESGENGAIINRSDGIAINTLKSLGIPVVIITGELAGPAFGRAKKLGIECIYSEDKLQKIVEYCVKNSVRLSEVGYIGNDINDLAPIASCGSSFVPRDSHPIVKKFAGNILKSNGGDGVLREVLEDFFL
jgi:YrbI family 3-deoxy-D-manno-octulosonate 8-phosphate phosphatase